MGNENSATTTTLSLPNVTSLSGGDLEIDAQGSGSNIDLPLLTSFDNGSLYVTDDGTVLAPDLTTLSGVDVTLDGTGTIATTQWQTLTDGELVITGGNYSSPSSPPFANLANINGSSLYVDSAASLTLPDVTSYTTTGYSEFYAEGTYNSGTTTTLSLPNVTSVSGGDLEIYSYGLGSNIDLPLLTSFDNGLLYVTDDGTVLAPDLTTLSGVNVTLDGTGTIATSQWQTLTNGQLTITGGDYSSTTSVPFAGLSDIDGSSIYVYGGGSLTLPAVTTYTNETGGYRFLQADSYYGYNYSNGTYYGTGSVGVLDLPSLSTIAGEYILVLTGGSGSEINLPDLTSFEVSNGGYLSVTSQATLVAPNSTTFVNVVITTDPTASYSVAANQTITFPGGTSTINTGTVVDDGSLDLGLTEPFELANYPGGGTGIIQSASASQSSPSSYDISVDIADPTEVYTLINSAYGEYGDTVGAVEFEATGGLTYTVDLVEGENIRDHNNDGYNNTIGQGALGYTYLGTASFGGGQVRLDEQGFVLPTAFQSATLTDIILLGYGNVPDGEPFLAAATVATSDGPVQVNINSLVDANLQTYANGGDYPLGGSTITANATVNIAGGMTINGAGALTVGLGSTLNVSGNLLGDTTNAAGFNILGTVVLDGNGTSSSPQQLEVMSQDEGNTAAGFTDNFAYNTLELANGTYVELVDYLGGTPEALYVNDLIVPAGTTLNLNGLNLYIHKAQIDGTIIGGAIITGQVYDDVSGSGPFSSGDTGLAGWTVTLINTSNNDTFTTTTDSNGDYAFAGIPVGSYTLSETLQSGFAQTEPASPGTYIPHDHIGRGHHGRRFRQPPDGGN